VTEELAWAAPITGAGAQRDLATCFMSQAGGAEARSFGRLQGEFGAYR
jgi:hypothetical protein